MPPGAVDASDCFVVDAHTVSTGSRVPAFSCCIEHSRASPRSPSDTRLSRSALETQTQCPLFKRLASGFATKRRDLQSMIAARCVRMRQRRQQQRCSLDAGTGTRVSTLLVKLCDVLASTREQDTR